MNKPFNIHEWQAKQRLAEQTDTFSKTKDSMDSFFGSGKSYKPDDNDQDLLIALRNQIEQGTINSKMRDKFVELLDGLIDKEDDPILEHTVTFTKDDMVTLHNTGELIKADDDGKDHTYIFDELDEQNTTGTGASFSAGNSPSYATPKAFGKMKDKDVEVLGYKKLKN